MLTAEDVLAMILKKRDEFAVTALTKPSGTQGYDYGKAVGFYTAYETVARDIEELIEKADQKEREEGD